MTIAVIRSAGVTSNAGLRAAKRAVISAGIALLDRDVGAARRRVVDGRARRDDVERDPVMRGEHGQRVGADLVRRVTVGGDPVGAGEHGVDLAGRHQRRGRRVGDHRVRDAGRLELPGGEPRALQERPRLVDPHVREQIALPGGEQRSDRAAVAAGRKPAGVAVGQRPRPRPEQVRGVRGHRTAAGDLVAMDPARPLGRGVGAHLVERPGEVDGGRARLAQHAVGRLQVLAGRRRERVAVGGGDPDRGRAAHDHRPDRVATSAGRAAFDLDLFAGPEAAAGSSEALGSSSPWCS